MDNDREPVNEELSIRHVTKLNQRAPKFEHLNKIGKKFDRFEQNFDKVSQSFDKVGYSYDKLGQDYDKVGNSLAKVGQKLNQVGQNLERVTQIVGPSFGTGVKLDRITFESEKLRSHSEASSRRNKVLLKPSPSPRLRGFGVALDTALSRQALCEHRLDAVLAHGN
ncbi:Uncharacterized protein OBRU01_17988, partial [Operophtera brumata]